MDEFVKEWRKGEKEYLKEKPTNIVHEETKKQGDPLLEEVMMQNKKAGQLFSIDTW